MKNDTRFMRQNYLIEKLGNALGDGFLIPNDREGWSFKCQECDESRAGNYGKHLDDCSIGIAVMEFDKYNEE